MARIIVSMSRSTAWDPAQYRLYADERSRPFFDLVGRIGEARPARVVDLGCGTGHLTAALLERWPDAEVEGVDSSAEMVAEAAPRAVAGRLRFTLADIRDWSPGRPVDVIVSNAALQWVPHHADLFPALVETLASGGWLAFQVPGNFGAASHTALHDLLEAPRWRDRLAGVEQPGSLEPEEYLARLCRLGCVVDAWETTYLHVLQGTDPVLEWITGTALRPVLARLTAAERPAFLAEYGARLRGLYPAEDFGTVLPFRRIFVVARRPS